MAHKYQKGDIVKPTIEPNGGEMTIQTLLGKMFGGDESNPLYECLYFNPKSESYESVRIVESNLTLIRKSNNLD